MNFARDVVDREPRDRLALIELAADGARNEYRFGEVADRSARLAGALSRAGAGRGDVVMTLIGSRPEWVFTMVACLRIGAAVLPSTEQLRKNDLALRLDVVGPKAIVADPRNMPLLDAVAPDCPVLLISDPELYLGDRAPAVDLGPEDPAIITFTSGTTGKPRAVVHGQRYLMGQALQSRHWLGARAGDLVWCTAATGWSKSARNIFIAPWLRGASALLHDARFDPRERVEVLSQERVSVLCMSPTEYRVIAKRTALPRFPHLRGLVAAGEALNPEILRIWQDATGLQIRDGYGQTETGQITGTPPWVAARPGSMGKPLPGVKVWLDDGELVVDPATVPTFFLGYLGEPPPSGHWRTGDRVREEDGFLYFEGRTDDVIISAGYRIGPFEVESALVSHPAVAEAAVVAAPDEDRGSVVRAVVVLREGYDASPDLASELQAHAKAETAPYKYPRIVDFVSELPKTESGKIKRSLLRA
jgi:acetyl-CoA synthetase